MDHPLLLVVVGGLLLVFWFRPAPRSWVPTGHRRTLCPRCDRVSLARRRTPLQPPVYVLCKRCIAEGRTPPYDVMRRESCPVCREEMWSYAYFPPGTPVRTDPLPESPAPCRRCRRRLRLRWVSPPHPHDRAAGLP